MTDQAQMKQLALAAKRFGEEIKPEFVADLIEQVEAVPDWDKVDELVMQVWQSGTVIDSESFLNLARLIACPEVFARIQEEHERGESDRDENQKEGPYALQLRCPDCNAPPGEPCNGDVVCQARCDVATAVMNQTVGTVEFSERYDRFVQARDAAIENGTYAEFIKELKTEGVIRCGGKGCTGGSCSDCKDQPTRKLIPCPLHFVSASEGRVAKCSMHSGHAGACQ